MKWPHFNFFSVCELSLIPPCLVFTLELSTPCYSEHSLSKTSANQRCLTTTLVSSPLLVLSRFLFVLEKNPHFSGVPEQPCDFSWARIPAHLHGTPKLALLELHQMALEGSKHRYLMQFGGTAPTRDDRECPKSFPKPLGVISNVNKKKVSTFCGQISDLLGSS